MSKRPTDYNALAARWQREAEDWSDPADEATSTALARRPATFVAPPAPERTMRQLPAADQVHQVDILPAASVQTQVRTSQVDHSKGFLIRTLPLAIAFSVAAVVVAVGLLAVPLASMRTLVVIFVTFAGVYAWAFWRDLATSPAGIALYHTQNLWKHIHEERRFRHRWYENERKETKR